MRLLVWLALRDLARDWVHLVCNVAVIAGVIVPLLVLYGVKNGVQDRLIGRLRANPATLQIDTAGNTGFARADLAEVQGWPETAFATLKVRSTFDIVNVRPVAGRGLRDAVMNPSGAGDPTLPPGTVLTPDTVAVSAALAQALEMSPGDEVLLISQAPDRPRQLAVPVRVAAVVPADRLGGRAVLADLDTLVLFEAFYDGYALPDHGIAQGQPLAARAETFAGLRAYARDLDQLGPLQARIEARFGVATQADVRAVEAVLSLGRNLDLALALTTGVAAVGLAATLVFGFWGEIARKRRGLAGLALVGLGPGRIAAIPVIQAVATAVAGLVASFALLGVAAALAARMFDLGPDGGAGGGAGGGGIVAISGAQAVTIAVAVVLFVTLSAGAAAMRAARVDPAIILREAG
jgi:putative ABC transport system permease protein